MKQRPMEGVCGLWCRRLGRPGCDNCQAALMDVFSFRRLPVGIAMRRLAMATSHLGSYNLKISP